MKATIQFMALRDAATRMTSTDPETKGQARLRLIQAAATMPIRPGAVGEILNYLAEIERASTSDYETQTAFWSLIGEIAEAQRIVALGLCDAPIVAVPDEAAVR